jgi:hypothetical protein
MEIQYALVTSSLGRVLVARTDRGICAVYPGDTDRHSSVSWPPNSRAQTAARW